MTVARTALACLLTIVWLPGCAAAVGATRERLTREQRAQVVQVLREELKTDPSILRDAILALQADDARIEAAAASEAVSAHRDALIGQSDPAVGSAHADATIVEFYDLRCPYCRQLDPALAVFLARDGRTALIYKDLPILGPASELGARAVLAAARQGGYVKLRDALMHASDDDYTLGSILRVAKRLGLDPSRLQRDMRDPEIQRRLEGNARLAKALGIDGTPTLVVGKSILEGPDATAVADAVAALRHMRGSQSHPSGQISRR